MTENERGSNPAAAPGASGPGEQGYDGESTVGDEGAVAGPEAYQDPFGRPEDVEEPAPPEPSDSSAPT